MKGVVELFLSDMLLDQHFVSFSLNFVKSLVIDSINKNKLPVHLGKYFS